MRVDADVIVVGAGPAGATTALLLARTGKRALLLDRREFPRAKPCGDCLSAGASTALRRLGLLEHVETLPHAALDGWRITAPDGRGFCARFAGADPAVDHALAVDRTCLDDALLRAAIRAGAEFRAGVHVVDVVRDPTGTVIGVQTAADTVRARAVIGADGLRSVVATRVGAIRRPARVRKVSLTARLHAPGLAGTTGEMHIGDGVVAGIAALDTTGRCNVTVVADATRFGRVLSADPTAFALATLESLPHVRGRVNHDAFSAAPLLASGPFDRLVQPAVFDGGALVGDAAGYFDPFTGQGIFQALVSAELLVPVLSHALDQGAVTARSLRAYVLQRRRLLRGTRELQRVIETILSRPALACAAIARIARAHRFAHMLIAVTGDIRRPVCLLSPLAVSSLLAPDMWVEDGT